MPTEIAIHPRERLSKLNTRLSRNETQKNISGNKNNAEVKSGNLILVSMDGRRQFVNVKMYNTSLEHFCVIYPQKKICKPIGVLNLKNTTVEKTSNNMFTIRQTGFDTPMALSFIVETQKELEPWILAFTNRSSPSFSSLPIVEEDEEI